MRNEIRGLYTHSDFEFTPRGKIRLVAIGQESHKQIYGKDPQIAVPCVLVERPSNDVGIGIGLYVPESRVLYRQMADWSAVIQVWRGMKVLERIDQVDPTTMRASLSLAKDRQRGEDEVYIDQDNLVSKVGGLDQLQALRQEVCHQAPSTNELQRMLKAMIARKIPIITGELKREIEAGTIERTPLIDVEIEKVEARVRAYEEREAALKVPLPPDKGIVDLFRYLEVGNLITGGGFGAYGLDWGPISLEDFEKDVRRASDYGQDGRAIDRMTTIPKSTKAEAAPGITIGFTEVGEIENPFVTLSDGRKLTFTRARFEKGGIIIKTKIEETNGKTSEGDFTVKQLREIAENQSGIK